MDIDIINAHIFCMTYLVHRLFLHIGLQECIHHHLAHDFLYRHNHLSGEAYTMLLDYDQCKLQDMLWCHPYIPCWPWNTLVSLKKINKIHWNARYLIILLISQVFVKQQQMHRPGYSVFFPPPQNQNIINCLHQRERNIVILFDLTWFGKLRQTVYFLGALYSFTVNSSLIDAL